MNGIALCGFMGCGKTTVANALELEYSLKHVDTDKYIEENCSLSIKEIFEKYGEEHFRELETNAIKALCENKNLVLALGGGAVMYERNVESLKENGYTIVFINTALDVIKKRLKNDSTRPLLKTNDIDTLYQKRIDTYNAVCDVKIDCSDEDGRTIAKMIIDKINKEGF